MHRQNSQQSFGAYQLYRFNVRKKVPFTPLYKQVEANFVKLGEEDFEAIKKYYSNNSRSGIACDFVYSFHKELENKDFFAMTLQENNLKHLDYKQIIGIASGQLGTSIDSDRNRLYICLLDSLSKYNERASLGQVKKKFLGITFSSDIKFKDVGKKMLHGFYYWTLPANIDGMWVKSMPSAEKFYKKMMFEDYSDGFPRLFDLKEFILKRENFPNVFKD